MQWTRVSLVNIIYKRERKEGKETEKGAHLNLYMLYAACAALWSRPRARMITDILRWYTRNNSRCRRLLCITQAQTAHSLVLYSLVQDGDDDDD